MSQPSWTAESARPNVRAVEDLPSESNDSAESGRAVGSGGEGRQQVYGMEAMSALAGGIAHVFNNMLTAIGFETELALEHLAQNDPAREHLREIEKVGERGAVLARQLLAFSGSQVLHPRPLQLNVLLAEMAENLRRLLGTGIELTTDCDPELDPVEVDREQLEQAILNLAVNAREVMPHGGVLSVRTENCELAAADLANPLRAAPGRYARLALTDTGTGMRDEGRRRGFEPFFTTKTGNEPAGLGLSSVYGIVTQSGGQIEVLSEPGKGSTFILFLPSHAPAAGEVAEHGAAAGNWETILLVEDEVNVRSPQAEILAGRGYNVLEAADAAEGLALCHRHKGPIHLMVTDILLGAMSGVELADKVAFERPEMKVLFASGYPAGLAELSGPGADRPLLKKPFTGRALAAKIREVLEDGA